MVLTAQEMGEKFHGPLSRGDMLYHVQSLFVQSCELILRSFEYSCEIILSSFEYSCEIILS